MKSVITTIIMFIGLYVLMKTRIFEFLSQDFVFPVIVGLIVAMLIITLVALGVQSSKKRGVKDDKDKHLD